ncbi:MAG: hypothetical protein IKE41_03225 [Clostridia bacterium]|nr:hypothetical protein [Clostridia bacterium]MBR2735562.1 hypothetical protein [Clostridia bacterium]
MEKVEVLREELKALNDEDLEQIAGSGDEKFVHITDEQCGKINKFYFDQEYRVVANYGGVCPRIMFEEALKKRDISPEQF